MIGITLDEHFLCGRGVLGSGDFPVAVCVHHREVFVSVGAREHGGKSVQREAARHGERDSISLSFHNTSRFEVIAGGETTVFAPKLWFREKPKSLVSL